MPVRDVHEMIPSGRHPMKRFANRVEAGRQLSEKLQHLAGEPLIVVGLPRGGVPVAAEVARALDAPLDVILVRKLGVPYQPELAMGAIGEDGIRIVNDNVVRLARITERDIEQAEERERKELGVRDERFRRGRARESLAGRTVVIVDDGIATGSTVLAACGVARLLGAGRIVVAVPVAPPDWEDRIDGAADELVCLQTPEPFFSVGQFYRDFDQTSDQEVIRCLERAAHRQATRPIRGACEAGPELVDEEVEILIGTTRLAGRLTVPVNPVGAVIFAHGSGSSRNSPRNRSVASVLNAGGLVTLLFDLLTPEEEADRSNVFDVGLLARRLVAVTAWLRAKPEMSSLQIGYFGASTGAAAALVAAAEEGPRIAAVVSRGGRADLAGSRLADVRAPTLLIVGSRDYEVLELNRMARRPMTCVNDLTVVTGASHLFEEGRTLQVAASAARDWFLRHLVAPTGRT